MNRKILSRFFVAHYVLITDLFRGSHGSILFTFSLMWVSEQHFAAENLIFLANIA